MNACVDDFIVAMGAVAVAVVELDEGVTVRQSLRHFVGSDDLGRDEARATLTSCGRHTNLVLLS